MFSFTALDRRAIFVLAPNLAIFLVNKIDSALDPVGALFFFFGGGGSSIEEGGRSYPSQPQPVGAPFLSRRDEVEGKGYVYFP